MKTWWKRLKCATCTKKFYKKDMVHIINVNTADGEVELKVCENCANFWDASADVLQKGRRNDENE